MVNKGKLTVNNVTLEPHEYDTVSYLIELGYDIELIPRSNIQGLHRPDIIMCGLEWEIKSPKGEGKWLIKNTLQKAQHQSENIIIDLNRIKIQQDKCILAIKREFEHSKRIRRIKVITKNRELLALSK